MRKDVNILKQISRTKLSLESKHKYPSLYQDISIGMCLLPCLSSKIINAISAQFCNRDKSTCMVIGKLTLKYRQNIP